MKLIIASNNAHKITEIKAILGGYFQDIRSLNEAGLDIDVVEDGETFQANALKKAAEVSRLAGCAALSDDSGLMVDALGGAPGVYSARYAGTGHDDEANNRKLLKALENVPEEARTARFVSAVALVWPDRPPVVAQGSVEGRILWEKRGESGFGYDPLFYYEPLNKTFAELTPEEKNGVSHRKRALTRLCELLDPRD